MITNKSPNDIIRMEIDLSKERADIYCPYCAKKNSVSYSNKKTSNSAQWWNISNFHRHLVTVHIDYVNFGDDCKYYSH